MRRSPSRAIASRKPVDAGLIWEGQPRRPGDRLFAPGEAAQSRAIAADGFDVVCFPVKVHRASAGWTRAVAIIND